MCLVLIFIYGSPFFKYIFQFSVMYIILDHVRHMERHFTPPPSHNGFLFQFHMTIPWPIHIFYLGFTIVHYMAQHMGENVHFLYFRSCTDIGHVRTSVMYGPF